MSLLTFLLMLVVAGFVVWGIMRALAGQWRELVTGVVILILVLWILGALGLTLPSIPTIR